MQVTYVKGYGKLAKDGKVEVKQEDRNTVTLSAKNTIIATGSAVTSLPGLDIDEERCVLGEDGVECHCECCASWSAARSGLTEALSKALVPHHSTSHHPCAWTWRVDNSRARGGKHTWRFMGLPVLRMCVGSFHPRGH